MKLGLKITSVAFVFALLTACGGGGGGGGGTGGGPTGPTGPTTGEFKLPSYVTETPLEGETGVRAGSSYLTEKPDNVELATNVTYDLANNRLQSAEYPGFTLYRGEAVAVLAGGNVEVQVYGLQYGDSTNRTNGVTKGNGSALMLFDSSGGVGAGGADLEANTLPSGPQTYKGYNFFRYTTAASGQQQSLQTGKFTFLADFAAGEGTLNSDTVSSVSTTGSTGLAGTKIEDQTVTIYTTGDNAGSYQGNIDIIPTTVGGTDGAALKAEIVGKFHGSDWVGISGTYHDTATARTFQGAIAGDINAPAATN